MNILHTVTIFPKISETFISDLIMRLIRLGHSGYILSRYHQCNLRPSQQDSITQSDILDANLDQNTFYFQKVIRKEKERYRFEPGFWRLLSSMDIIVAHFADIPAEMAMVISKQAKKPFIFFAHAREIFVDPDYSLLQKKSLSAQYIIVPTIFNREYILRYLGGELEDKIKVIHYGIDLDYFEAPPPRRNREQLTICTIGRFVEKKGIEYTLRTFARVFAQHPNIRLKIIGDGELKADLLQLARDLEIVSRVEFTGLQDHRQVRNELRNCDIFILPSVTAQNGDREGLPVSILEAMAMELPVLSTYHTGIPEAVSDCLTGFLTQERDVDALSQKLSELVANETLRLEMGKKGRKMIENKYNQTIETNLFIQLVSHITCNNQ